MTLKDMLILHEGLRLKPYEDTVGKLTIGVGRNLTDKGVSRPEAIYMLDNDISEHNSALYQNLPWIADLSPDRQIVLQNMCFNLGIDGLLTFKNTLSLIKGGRYDEAATNMLLSKWAQQVGKRANFLADIMRKGEQ